MQKLSLLLLTGFGAGVLSGVFGIGGGVILVPVSVLLLGMTQQAASGTSLVALLAPVGILGVAEYYRSGKIGPENIKTGLIMAAGMLVGAYFGARIAVVLPETILRKAFSIFLGLIAVKMWFM